METDTNQILRALFLHHASSVYRYFWICFGMHNPSHSTSARPYPMSVVSSHLSPLASRQLGYSGCIKWWFEATQMWEHFGKGANKNISKRFSGSDFIKVANITVTLLKTPLPARHRCWSFLLDLDHQNVVNLPKQHQQKKHLSPCG